jgi:AcrR family transcriptional regulator
LTQPQRVELSSQRLVEAAAELIVEKGWEATTAAEIGRRAGYSRAMVHARYGNKDAILDAFLHQYMKRLNPDPDPAVSGMEQALAHLDRIEQLYTEDQDFLRAMFVATFEAVKSTSPLRHLIRTQLQGGAQKVERALRKGLRDGSVRPDIDLGVAVNDISAVVFGVAYSWIALPERYNLGRELKNVRARIIADYGNQRRKENSNAARHSRARR